MGDGVAISDWIMAGTTGNAIYGNIIGTDATGTLDWGNDYAGIHLSSTSDLTIIGGLAPYAANTIAYSYIGILVDSVSTQNTIRGNSIHSNHSIGIDLNADGANANDAGDGDSGGNTNLNWPVLNTISIADDGTMSYTLNTTTLVAGTYTIDFYASSDRDGGDVEGERFLGSGGSVSGGIASFSSSVAGITVAPGEYVTVLVTDASGNTSEFSNYAVATDSDAGGTTPSDLSVVAANEGGLSINSDAGNDIYLIADDGGAILGGESVVTVEVQYSTTGTGKSMPLFSYASSQASNDLLMYVGSSGNLDLYLFGDHASTSGFDFGTLADGQPHSVALTFDGTAGTWEVFVDGVSIDSGSGLTTGSFASDGTLLFGQDQRLD